MSPTAQHAVGNEQGIFLVVIISGELLDFSTWGSGNVPPRTRKDREGLTCPSCLAPLMRCDGLTAYPALRLALRAPASVFGVH